APAVFTTDTTVNREGWGGLRFLHSEGVSKLRSCIVEHGRAVGYGDYGLGGGLFLDQAEVELNASTVQYCVAGSGHGIYARAGSRLTANDCQFLENGTGIGSGGAVCLRTGSSLTASGTHFANNQAFYGGALLIDRSSALLVDCIFQKNTADISGGAIFGSDATLTARGTRFSSNRSVAGGAVDARASVQVNMERCRFVGNSAMLNGAHGSGGALLFQSGSQNINHCTFVNNSAASGGAIHGGVALRLSNSIIVGQHQGGGVHFPTPGAIVRYSCFANNTGGSFTGPQTPRNIGLLTNRNANGDSCDAYCNILLDPLFNDSTETGIELTPGSPCIDAGDPLSSPDPDGSLPDLGALWYAPLSVNEDHVELPAVAMLLPAYPNPFNPATTLAFDLARPGLVSLKVFDLLGREMAVLLNGSLQPGRHSLQWNAAEAPAGTYFAVLETAGVRTAQKLLLLK
ncbi:right-handed parallel beta-helix repeat-containing protein, partial [bacterium]|nr:right-handed parallel beta-helix repeat-containing protein [bacterium]